MVKFIDCVNKRSDQLSNLMFLSELLRDYINGPEETINWISESVDSRITGVGLSEQFTTVKDGMYSPYSKNHAIELGRKIILRNIENLQNEIAINNTAINNAFIDMRKNLEDNFNVLKGNLDLSTIYATINQNRNNRLLEEYFVKTLETTIKLNMIGNSDITSTDYLSRLGNIVPKMVEDVWNDFDTLVNQYKSQTEYLVTKYNKQNLKDTIETPLNTFTKTDKPEEPTKEPDITEIIKTYIEKVEGKPNAGIIDGLGKVLESLDSTSSVINDKISQLVDILDKLSESEFKQFNTMVNNFVELGPKNYEKINGTDDEYKELIDYNLRYIPAQDKIDKYFMIGFYNTYIGTNMIIKTYYQIAITIAKLIGNGVQ